MFSCLAVSFSFHWNGSFYSRGQKEHHRERTFKEMIKPSFRDSNCGYGGPGVEKPGYMQ